MVLVDAIATMIMYHQGKCSSSSSSSNSDEEDSFDNDDDYCTTGNFGNGRTLTENSIDEVKCLTSS